MKRYNAVVGGVYDPSVMVEEKDGDYVWYEDVERLEAINAELLEALEEIMNQTDQRSNYLIDHVYLIARAAIAKAKGESNE